MAPRHARVDLRSDLHLRDLQRLYTGARGLATGDDQLPHAPFDQPACDRGDGAFDHGAGFCDTELRLHRLHGTGLGGRIDQYRPVREPLLRPGQGRGHDVLARRELYRIDGHRRSAGGLERRHLAVRRQRATARHDGLAAGGGGQGAGLRRGADAEVLRQADGDARTRGDQRQVLQRGAQAQQVVVGHCIDDGHAHALRAQFGHALLHGLCVARHHAVVDQADRTPGLGLHDPYQVRVGHRCQRMVLHAALIEQRVSDEQVALEHAALVVGKGGRGDREVGAQRVHQRLGHRADVAVGRAVEGRAVLEVDLAGALGLQPAQGLQRLRHRVGGGDGARLERHDDGLHVGVERCLRHADGLRRAHAGAHEVVGKIGGTGEIVGDTAQQDGGHGGCGSGGGVGETERRLNRRIRPGAGRCPGKS